MTAPRRPSQPTARPSRTGCRFITGDPRQPGWSWCDLPTVPGKSWCEAHCLVVFQQPEPEGEQP